MKTYWDLNQAERVNLTAKEITKRFIPIELASNGILTPKEPEYIELPPEPETEIKVRAGFIVRYTRGTSSYKYDWPIVFNKIKDAEAFIAARPGALGYAYVGDKQLDTVEEIDGQYIIEMRQVATLEDVQRCKELRRDYDQIKNENTSMRDKYERDKTAVERATEGIWNNWQELRTVKQDMLQVYESVLEFTKIAEGNINIGIKFALKGNTDPQLVYDAMVEHGSELQWTEDAFEGHEIKRDGNPYRGIK